MISITARASNKSKMQELNLDLAKGALYQFCFLMIMKENLGILLNIGSGFSDEERVDLQVHLDKKESKEELAHLFAEMHERNLIFRETGMKQARLRRCWSSCLM